MMRQDQREQERVNMEHSLTFEIEEDINENGYVVSKEEQKKRKR